MIPPPSSHMSSHQSRLRFTHIPQKSKNVFSRKGIPSAAESASDYKSLGSSQPHIEFRPTDWKVLDMKEADKIAVRL